MKLTTLNPRWMHYSTYPRGIEIEGLLHGFTISILETREKIVEVPTKAEANGIRFTCPNCRTHDVTCWSKELGVPYYAAPMRYRWTLTGDDLHTVTIRLQSENEMVIDRANMDCSWNGSVIDGEVI